MDVPVVPTETGENSNSDCEFSPPKNALYKYDFVLNNYSNLEVCQIKDWISRNCLKGGFGFEVGKLNGVPHLQGFLHLEKKQRFTSIAKNPGFERCSFRACRNEKALIKYCQKDNISWTFGLPKELKVISTLRPWQDEILTIYKGEPSERAVYWFWESNGGIGKSAFCKYLVHNYGALFCNGGKSADLINLIFNQNMDNCKCIIWDLPRENKGKISSSTVEAVKNGMVCNTKYETGTKLFNSPHVFIFSNYKPDCPEELSSDRWIIKCLDENEGCTPGKIPVCLIDTDSEYFKDI